MRRYFIYTDGGARGNPGSAAIGIVIKNENRQNLKTIARTIGQTTNNVAEYTAVVEALKWLKNNMQIRQPPDKYANKPTLQFFLDSKLVVNQLNGLFKMKDGKLRSLLLTIRLLEQEIKVPISYNLIPREQNREADLLVNQALDQA